VERRDSLYAAVELILKRDEEFPSRMQEIDDMQAAEDQSMCRHENDTASADVRRQAIRAPDRAPPGLRSLLNAKRGFEMILEQSRVYSRTRFNKSDIWFTSSAGWSHAWSHLSLNDISVISVFRLPVTLDDITSFGPGLTFVNLLQQPTPLTISDAQGAEEDGKSSASLPIQMPNISTARAGDHGDRERVLDQIRQKRLGSLKGVKSHFK
jgi:hypothetical protein